jgi:hypothetical protein
MAGDKDPTVVWNTNEIPDDPALLEAMGRLAIRHSQLDYMLRYVFKTLSGRTVNEIMDHTAGWQTNRLQRKVREVAARKLDKEPREKLEDLLDQCQEATNTRNDILHADWYKVAKSDPPDYRMTLKDGTFTNLPTTDQLLALSRTLLDLADRLNEARLSGFLRDAL